MNNPRKVRKRNRIKRFTVGLTGGFLLIVGIVAIPYPGPGWLIVISSLALLATEFEWAKKLLGVVKSRYDAWEAWMARQNWPIKLVFWLFTCVVVVITIWLLNGYGLVNGWFDLGLDWLNSPLPFL